MASWAIAQRRELDIIAKGLGFEDPATGQVVPKDEGISSGNVGEKLRASPVDENPQYQVNVERSRASSPSR